MTYESKRRANQRYHDTANMLIAAVLCYSLATRETRAIKQAEAHHQQKRVEAMKRISENAAMIQARWEAKARAQAVQP